MCVARRDDGCSTRQSTLIYRAIQSEFVQCLFDDGDVIAEQYWDSSGPGAGAGCVTVYDYFGSYVALNDDGPYVYATRQAAIDDVTTVIDATVSINVY